MEKLKGAIIGCGMIAREHLRAIRQLKNVEIAAICDLSPARAEATAERFCVAKWYTDYEQLLAQIQPDLVHITTPPSAHFAIAEACLSAGHNVICEKPITCEYNQFVMLKRLAQEKHCVFMENQNFRFHSSVRQVFDLIDSGELGEVIDVQIHIALNLFVKGSPYGDQNAPHFSSVLKGGVIGDFLPHIAYLTCLFIGRVIALRTIWTKRNAESAFPADEFRGFLSGERANAYVAFSGNANPSGFWLRVTGTRMHVECNLFEPPRLTVRRIRSAEPAIGTVINGINEARDILRGTVAGFARKLGGVSSYDGLPELISRTYRALELHEPQPVSLEEIDESARLVEQFTNLEVRL